MAIRMNSLRFVLIVLVVSILPITIFAAGSKEKSPTDETAKKDKQALAYYNDGVKMMKKADEIAMKGDSTFAYNYRATSDAKAEKEYVKAIKNFNSAIDLKPEIAEAHNNLGYCYRKIGRLKESLTAYNNALAIDKNFAQAREYLGETYLAMGEIDKANEELKFLLKLKSPYADTLQKSIDEYKLHQLKKKMDTEK